MVVYIGSARHDEFGKYIGGKAGDQKQKINAAVGLDLSGEVSAQTLTSFIGTRRWYILRPKQAAYAKAIAQKMTIAVNNLNLGYDQTGGKKGRLGVVSNGVGSKSPTEADCGTTVRACVKEATGVDVGDFTTGNERTVLEAAKDKNGNRLFDKAIIYRAGVQVYEGDIFVTQTKGHTGICIIGLDRVVSRTAPAAANGKFIYKNVDFSPVFNPTYYRDKYKAKESAFAKMTDAQAFTHFCTFGMKERRQASAEFNIDVYRARYTDLQAAYGDDYPSYYLHYCLLGKTEGRKAI